MPQKSSNKAFVCNKPNDISTNNIKSDFIYTNGAHFNGSENNDAETAELQNSNNMEELSFAGRQLSIVMINNKKQLNNLIQLDLSDNCLNTLPDEFDLLEKLQCLLIDKNRFFCLPKVIAELKSLKTLSARENGIMELPDNLSNLVHLENVDLSSNKLINLPLSCTALNSLKNLCLKNNKLNRIPQCIVNGMNSLKSLNLSENKKCMLNYAPCSKQLVSFCAMDNISSSEFPKWILSSKYTKLENVLLDNTCFLKYDIPEKSTAFVKKLSMKQCQLSNHIIQKITATMHNLEKLSVGNNNTLFLQSSNCFWSLPIQSLKSPSSLTELDVFGTGIPIIPRDISNYINLSIMDLSFNQIHWLPDEICLLKNMEILLINNNKLSNLPENLGHLSKLKKLKVGYNYICQIPSSMENMKELLYLDLYNNEFTSFDDSLMKIQSLLGLDLEQNYFSTNNLKIMNTDYENLRDTLRECCFEYCRIDGPKALPESALSPSNSFSSLKMLDYSDLSDSDNYDINHVSYENDEKLKEENWDLSDDSSSEFDPYEYCEPKVRVYPPSMYGNSEIPTFCPSDLHRMRTFDIVKQILREGSIIQPREQEGQFEDAL